MRSTKLTDEEKAERHREAQRRYHLKNKEKTSAYWKEYYKRNKEQIKKRRRGQYDKEYYREYRKKNAERYRESQRRYKEKIRLKKGDKSEQNTINVC